MAITGDYSLYAPDIAESMEEAFERAGVAPQAIGQEHMYSALRSIKLLFAEWQTYGVLQWTIAQVSQTLTAGDADFDLPVGAVDIFDAVIRRSGRDTPMYRMGRAEYLQINDKTSQGRPSQYWVNRLYDRATVTVWQAPENSTDIMVIDYLRQMSNPGTPSNTLQMPPEALEAFHAGLAMKLAQKYNLDRYNMLREDYGGRDYPQRRGGKLFWMLAARSTSGDLQLTIRR